MQIRALLRLQWLCAWIIVDSAEVVRVVRTVPKANQRPRQQLLSALAVMSDRSRMIIVGFSLSSTFLDQLCSSRQLRKVNSPVPGDRFGPETPRRKQLVQVNFCPNSFQARCFLLSLVFKAFQSTDFMSYRIYRDIIFPLSLPLRFTLFSEASCEATIAANG